MIGPVHWGSFGGEFLERVMAVFVAQDHKDVIRRVPASGDGGIDLLIPNDDGYEVLQVKGFTGRVGSSERRQLRKSLTTTLAEPRLNAPITSYAFVVPTDLTPDEQDWFDEMRADAPWDVSWRGIPFWDSCASTYGNVVDYMIGGGAERVRERSRTLLDLHVDPGEALLPANAMDLLSRLQKQLNAEDPHYRYEISTSSEPPGVEEANGAAMMATRSISDGFVTVKVVPKHRYALEDAPIQGTLTIRTDESPAGRALREQFDGFQRFGRDLTIPDGMLAVDIEAPGGLGGNVASAGGRIFSPTKQRDPLRFVTVDPDGEPVAEIEVLTMNVTAGTDAAEVHLQDAAGVLSAQMLVPNPDVPGAPSKLDFRLTNPAGRPVVAVLPAFRVFQDRGPGHALQVRPQFGNRVLATAPLSVNGLAPGESVMLHLEDLGFLQSWAEHTLLVPDEIEPDVAGELNEYVRMLRGEILTGTWRELSLSLDVPRTEVPGITGGTSAMAVVADMSFEHSGGRVELGPFKTIYANATLADTQPADDCKVIFVPNGEPTFTRSAGEPGE